MNKNAAVMAADSAVTLGNHAAIHNSQNKLFQLSNVAPIGLFAYGSTAIMGVPIEIIANEYRKYLGDKTFPFFMLYVNDFLKFIEENYLFFKFDEYENVYIHDFIHKILYDILDKYKDSVIKAGKNPAKLDPDSIKSFYNEAFANFFAGYDKRKEISKYDFNTYARNKYYEGLKNEFENRDDYKFLNNEQKEILLTKSFELLNKEMRLKYTGISITGYGEKEIFPSNFHFTVDSILGSKIRINFSESFDISEQHKSCILSYAQHEIIRKLTQGIDTSFKDYLLRVPESAKRLINDTDDSFFARDKKEVVCKKIFDYLTFSLDGAILAKEMESDLSDSIVYLPVTEMGSLAESLINITCILRQVKIDQNNATVGGPIDVCAISKSKGFVWIKKKIIND
jgi:hypothetical protein